MSTVQKFDHFAVGFARVCNTGPTSCQISCDFTYSMTFGRLCPSCQAVRIATELIHKKGLKTRIFKVIHPGQQFGKEPRLLSANSVDGTDLYPFKDHKVQDSAGPRYIGSRPGQPKEIPPPPSKIERPASVLLLHL